MAILVLDPQYDGRIPPWVRDDRYDEVWEGMLVMSPLPGNQHQIFVCNLSSALLSVVTRGKVYPGVNVSDRSDNWMGNFRCPDVAVYLAGNPAEDRDSYMLGGPDFAVEIASPGENPFAKLDFYAAVNTRELLVVRRNPWSLELFCLSDKRLVSTGRVDLDTLATLTSEALGMTLRLVPGRERPEVELVDATTGRTWLA